MLHDCDFMRDGQIEPPPSHSASARNRILETSRRDLDGQIAPVQARSGKAGFLHHSSWILGYRLSETRNQVCFIVCRHRLLGTLLQRSSIEHPSPEDFIAPIARIVAATTLVTVFLPALHVERLSENLALFYVSFVDTLKQGHVVRMQPLSGSSSRCCRQASKASTELCPRPHGSRGRLAHLRGSTW